MLIPACFLDVKSFAGVINVLINLQMTDSMEIVSGKHLSLPTLVIAILEIVFWLGTAVIILLVQLAEVLTLCAQFVFKKHSAVQLTSGTVDQLRDERSHVEIPIEGDHLAGKCEVVTGREDLVDVTKNQLITDYNSCIGNDASGYCFLRVLSGKEKSRFIDKMESGLVDYCYRTRAIKTRDWMRILENIVLETEYYVYRKSYWGENAGRSVVSPQKTSTMALVSVISGARAKVSEDETDGRNEEDEYTGLIKGISRLRLTANKRVNLLIEDNHVAIINKVKPACWSNDSYVLDDTEDEIKM